MAIVQPTTPNKILLDLRGENGNAFVLLGVASRLSRTMGFSVEEGEQIQKRMKSSDYNHLVHVMEHFFSDQIDFVLPPEMARTWDPNYSIFQDDETSVEVVVKKKIVKI